MYIFNVRINKLNVRKYNNLKFITNTHTYMYLYDVQ